MDALLCLSLLTNCTLSANNPEVTTSFGTVQGFFTETVDGKVFAAFEGIPYAKPPVGKNRFKEPQPIKPWVGLWQAKTQHVCLQYDHYVKPGNDPVIGEEDCLYLNVYTPATRSLGNSLLDVIVFIHGGAFMFNSAHSYGPKIIMNHDVVFVTLNYRLGPLGFLSTEDSIVPGNNGIKDQILALRWIKENINRFGGNPESITLSGMSAGGASVHIHFLSPLSNGLFDKAIMQSGTALNPWVLTENSLDKAKKLAALNGCPTMTTREMIDCLKNRPAYQIVKSVKYFLAWLYNPFSPFGVTVDKWSPEPVLPDHPYVLLRNKQVQDLPLIISNVESEGLYPAAQFYSEEKYMQIIDTCWDELIPFILDFNNTVLATRKKDVSQKIRKFYFNNEKVSRENFKKLVNMCSDRLFVTDIERTARLQAASMTSPVYYYYFKYRGAHSKSEYLSKCNENFGASHGDDTIYVLSSSIDTHSVPQDKRMSEIITNVWLSFAATGIPKINNTQWPTVSSNPTEPLDYLEIKSPDNIKAFTADFLGNRDFWDSLPIKENKRILIMKDEL